MIHWIKYDPANPPLDEALFIVLDDENTPWTGYIANGQWCHDWDGEPIPGNVVLYSVINLPGEDKA